MFNLFEGAQKKFNDLLAQAGAAAEPTESTGEQPPSAAEQPEAEAGPLGFSLNSVNAAFLSDKFKEYAKKASENLVTAQEQAAKLGTLVSQNLDGVSGEAGEQFNFQTFLGDLNKEQQNFEKELAAKAAAQPEGLPWEGVPDEAETRRQVLLLSQDERSFLEEPPVLSDEAMDISRLERVAQKLVEFDPNVLLVRYQLVPRRISEETFWRNYLYRVQLVCKAAAARQQQQRPGSSAAAPAEPAAPSAEPAAAASSADTKPAQPKETRKNAEQNSGSSPDEDDWETEFLQEMPDYDVVKEGKADEQWNDELDELLESCSEPNAAEPNAAEPPSA